MNISRVIAVVGFAAALVGAAPEKSEACCWWLWPHSCCYRPVNCCYTPTCCPSPCASPCGYGGCNPCGAGGCGVGGYGVTPTYGSPCGPGGCGISYRAPLRGSFYTAAGVPGYSPSRMVYRPAPVLSVAPQSVPVNYGYTAAPVIPQIQPRMTTIPARRAATVTNSGWAPVSMDRVVSRF